MLRYRIAGIGAMAAVAAVALAGCSGGGGGDSTGGGGGGGDEITIVGAFTADQADAFQADLDAWSETSGITATYTGNSDFQTAIIAQVAGGNPPDIAIYPQPGVLKSQINTLYPLEDLGIDVDSVISDEANGLGEVGAVDGETYGLFYSVNVKSLVWYNPAAFEAAGLTVPTTDDEMTALSQQIIDEGLGYPMCAGIESGGATGWPATDWLEEYVLRYGGLDSYLDWVNNDIPWTDPIIAEAGDKVAEELLAEGQVNGGGPAIATTSFQSAGNPLFVSGKENGQCFMYRQGTFIADFFPDDIKEQIAAGDFTNVNFFPLPTPDGATAGVVGGGDLVGAFSNDEDTAAVVEYLVSSDFGTNGYADQAIFISPHNDFDQSQYASELQRSAAEVLAGAEIFGFDASDQMPGEVGSGAAFSNLTSWFAGQKTMDQAFADIQAAYGE